MNTIKEVDDPRRRVLVGVLTVGLIAAGLPVRDALARSIFGNKPKQLPPGRSIYSLSGTVMVNGTKATLETLVRPGDTIETGKNSEIIFVVSDQSMILRSESHLVIEGEGEGSFKSWVISGMRMLTGKMLTVSRNRNLQVHTAVATIGIRGTGWYVESDPEQTYFCTCYGESTVAANHDLENKETVVSEHHDRPLYILGESAPGRGIRNAPFINHTDQELILIETLVGRTVPFVFTNEEYSGPRREY
jgi:FecR protein